MAGSGAGSDLCFSCNLSLPSDDDYVLCVARKCKLHYTCAGITEKTYRTMGQQRRDSYVCILCRNKDRNYGSNVTLENSSSLDSSSSKASTPTEEQAVNVTLDMLYKKLLGFETTVSKNLEKLVTVSHFKEEIDGLKTSVQFCSDKVDEFKKDLESANSKIKSLEKANNNLAQQNVELGKWVGELSAQIEDMQQYSRNHNIEIHGIPEARDEHVFNLVNKLAVAIDEPVVLNSDIQAAHRLGNRKGSRPRPIVVRFSNRQKRDAVLEKSRKIRLQTTHFVHDVPEVSVYVNEHLTKYNKNLLFEAKKYKLTSTLKYVWVKGAKIFTKMDDGAETKRITRVSDLTAYYGPLQETTRDRQQPQPQHRHL